MVELSSGYMIVHMRILDVGVVALGTVHTHTHTYICSQSYSSPMDQGHPVLKGSALSAHLSIAADTTVIYCDLE